MNLSIDLKVKVLSVCIFPCVSVYFILFVSEAQEGCARAAASGTQWTERYVWELLGPGRAFRVIV